MFSATSRLALGYTSMLVHSFVRRGMLRREAVRDALVRQIHFTGVRALPYVAVVALLFGAIAVTRVLAILGADNETALKAVIGGGIRELGPLVTALIVIVRSSVAIAAEVGLMRLRSGISAELWKDAVHEEEVVLPRVLGVAIACALLVSVFQFTAIGSALAATALTLDTAFSTELEEFLIATEWWQVPVSLVKGAVFGAGIAAIACYHGLHVEPEIGEIPRAVVAACVGSLTFVIALDLLAVLLLLA